MQAAQDPSTAAKVTTGAAVVGAGAFAVAAAVKLKETLEAGPRQAKAAEDEAAAQQQSADAADTANARKCISFELEQTKAAYDVVKDSPNETAAKEALEDQLVQAVLSKPSEEVAALRKRVNNPLEEENTSFENKLAHEEGKRKHPELEEKDSDVDRQQKSLRKNLDSTEEGDSELEKE